MNSGIRYLVVVGFLIVGNEVQAHDPTGPSAVFGDELSDALSTSSIAMPNHRSCSAEKPVAMTSPRNFDILSAIGPRVSSVGDATP
jgi:hypothetical protein